jgi:hypothetical protein
MGDVTFLMFNTATGAAQGTVSGAPADVADFLAIWVKNTEEGLSLERQLGVEVKPPSEPLADE